MTDSQSPLTHFYEALPVIESIRDITEPRHYRDVPEDWYIVISDVVNSTQAIQNGKYRDVNSVAAASVTALLNRVPNNDLPFVFGGDGATILIPPQITFDAASSLLATQQLAREIFQLEMRIGLIPVKDVLRDGYAIQIGRLKMSDNFHQAIFMGGGLAHADRLLKDPESGQAYRLTPKPDQKYEANFDGFECRWQEIPSPHGEVISLLVMALGEDTGRVYRDALAAIERIYGEQQKRHPLVLNNLRLAWNPLKFRTEAALRYRDTSLRMLFKLGWWTFLARMAMRFNLQGWGEYPQILIEATDHEKFDDTLRMTIAGTAAQREGLRDYLEQQYRAGRLVYGIHSAGHTLITCIVFDHFGRQVHLIDSAKGGYALAAKELKAQLKARSEQP